MEVLGHQVRALPDNSYRYVDIRGFKIDETDDWLTAVTGSPAFAGPEDELGRAELGPHSYSPVSPAVALGLLDAWRTETEPRDPDDFTGPGAALAWSMHQEFRPAVDEALIPIQGLLKQADSLVVRRGYTGDRPPPGSTFCYLREWLVRRDDVVTCIAAYLD